MNNSQTIALSIILTLLVIGTGCYFLIKYYEPTPVNAQSTSETAQKPAETKTTDQPNDNQANSTTDKTMTDNNTQSDEKLEIKDTLVGTGTEVKSGDTVTINYTGKLTNGKVFDSSLNPGRTPFSTQIGVGQVIQGWDEGVVGMKVGGKRTLTIPPSLGYGNQAQGDSIPANSTLIFELELLDVKPKV